VTPADIRSRLRPFEPFRIFASNGEVFDIRSPEMIMVLTGSVIIGFPARTEPDTFERFTQLSLQHIVKIEPLAVPTRGNGQG
jgi:hypothetical protein